MGSSKKRCSEDIRQFFVSNKPGLSPGFSLNCCVTMDIIFLTPEISMEELAVFVVDWIKWVKVRNGAKMMVRLFFGG